MEELKFLYSFESYQRNNGLVSDFGEIYIKVGEYFFPEEHWTDFGCGAIYTWAEEFIKLIEGGETKVECNFYDGAFLFYIEKIDISTWKLSFVDESMGGKPEKEIIVSASDASDELLKAARFMENIRDQQSNFEALKKYETRIVELEVAIKKLKSRG